MLVEDVFVTETPSYHGSFGGFRNKFDLEMAQKLAKNHNPTLSSKLQNLDHADKKAGDPGQAYAQQGRHAIARDDAATE